MTRKTSCHLLDMLAQVADPRHKKGKRPPLKALLALAVIATMCGYKRYRAIAEWGRTYDEELTKRLGFTHKKTPCAATLHNLFKRLDIAALERVLSDWAMGALAHARATEGGLTAVAIDGKTLRSSQKQHAALTHLMSVVSHELGISLAQKAMGEKTHEVPVSMELLKMFDVRGKVVTADALLTQRAFCAAVVAAGGDYVLPVKRNQKQTYEAIACLFQLPRGVQTFEGAVAGLESEHRAWGEALDTSEVVEKGHGRLEVCRLTSRTALNAYLDWPGVSQVFVYTYCRKNMRTGEERCERRYGVTSLDVARASAAYLLGGRRGHWTIETKCHWVRDVILGEDASQVRCGGIPAVMGAVRNTALSVLRLAGYRCVAKTMRYFAAHPQQALRLITETV